MSGGGISREVLLKRQRQADMRERIKAGKCLAELEGIGRILQLSWRTLEAQEVAALKLRTDILFRKLNKVLPDVKQVEFDATLRADLHAEVSVKTEDVANLTTDQLRAAIAELAARGATTPGGAGQLTLVHDVHQT